MTVLKYKRFNFVLVCFFLLVHPFFKTGGQDEKPVHYSSYSIQFRIIDSISGYVETISATGETSGIPDNLAIPFTSLMDVKIPEIRIQKKNGKWKQWEAAEFTDLDIDFSVFHSDRQWRRITLPANSRFIISEVLHCRDIFLLPSMILESNHDVDTMFVEIKYPADYICRYELCNADSNITIGSGFAADAAKRLNVKLHPHRGEPLDGYPEPARKAVNRYPELRVLILPPTYRGREDQYLNDWFNHVLGSLDELSPSSLKVFDGLVDQDSPGDSIIRIISDYLRKKVKYLDVEEGLGSFQPSDPNETLFKLQGDCKDMAFLLCSVLSKYGIDAKLALASTWYNNTDLDFPNLQSCDHAICAVNEDGDWKYMDLTEKYGIPGFPRMIQNRHVYIVDSSRGITRRVMPLPPDSNIMEWDIRLKQMPEKLEGTFSLMLSGMTMIRVNEIQALSPIGTLDGLESYLDSYSDQLIFDSIIVVKNPRTVQITGKVSTKNRAINAGNNVDFLWKNFIPYPHPFTRMINQQHHFNEHTLLSKLKMTIELDQIFSKVSEPDYVLNDPISSFSAKCYLDEPCRLRYTNEFELGEIEFSGKRIDEYNQMNRDLKKYFNHVFILE